MVESGFVFCLTPELYTTLPLGKVTLYHLLKYFLTKAMAPFDQLDSFDSFILYQISVDCVPGPYWLQPETQR